MRPPITSTTLQQNESSRQQLQQQQQQQQFQTKPNEITLQSQQLQQQQQIARKIKLPQQQQHDILVENHLNSACTTEITTHTQAVIKSTHPKQPISIARKASPPIAPHDSHSTYQASYKFDTKLKRNRLYNHNNGSNEETEEAVDQQQQQQYQQQRQDLNEIQTGIRDIDDDNFTVQLVDLSTSPPSPLLLPLPPAQHHSIEQLYNNETPVALELPTKRSSIISDCQYSTQSSTSSDDVSLSFNTNIKGFLTHSQKQQQQPHQHLQQQQSKRQQKHYYTRANSFDDAAEHFIINFPGDSFLSRNQNDCIINLPLSETEPLLTNIEATIADKQRSICLNKNSASLIFTKKEIPSTKTASNISERIFRTTPLTNNNHNSSSSSLLQQEQQQNINRHSTNLNPNTRRCHSLRANYTTSSSAATLINSNRRPTKHLPATYHQQQRRSLQLNYNNNLVTTSTCSSNNNNCCSTTASNKGINSTNAALHRHHHRSHPQSSTALSSSGVNENRTTATATRKQHAYSWYAPVYSALEEELEQDSRDSSPIRNNLANTKKHLTTTHYPHRSSQKHTTTSSDNETVALLETRNQINIQAQLHAQQSKSGSVNSGGSISIGEGLPASQRKGNASAQALTLQLNSISGGTGSQVSQNYETEGPHAGSLGLAGGPLPKRKRLENLEKFFKSLVGLRPSSNNNGTNTNPPTTNHTNNGSLRSNSSSGVVEVSSNPMPLPSSPEIRITRTPSDQNIEMSESERQLLRSSDKLTAQPCHSSQGSTSSLHVVQQKIWNVMRREASAASLYQDKSQSLVHHSGLRKCETVLALSSRQGNPNRSPVHHHSNCLTPGQQQQSVCGINHAPYMGSGIFNENGVEQIRPLNRLRNSTASINAATNCSRCSSLLSLAASGSRYSLNVAASGFVHSSASHQLLPPIPASTTFQIGAQPQPQQRRYTSSGMVRRFSCGSRRSRSCSTSSHDENSLEPGICTPNSVPQRKISTCSCTSSSGISCSRKSSAGAQSSTTNSSISPPSNQTTATLNSSLIPSSLSTALATTASYNSTPTSPTITPTVNSSNTPNKVKHSPSAADLLCLPLSPITAGAATSKATLLTPPSFEMQPDSTDGIATAIAITETTTSRPFQMFTCKLCLIDVETVNEATTLIQCGCQFCTECMKAYVEFEISEGAYEISCPDAQCPAQGAITLPEIANLTTANLMKKHHRYRLNREIELDKTRTWCPRAGCETVCCVEGIPELNTDAAPSTSSAASNSPTSPANANGTENTTQLRCAVQCPSCKDEFCSACKKTWHPNMTCEENSRRLVADGQDDIGIPFDNDLIKCCPMCAVPIEKDEGCAQMMCKRCKHVFCWYCLASLDDDFLLRHYDKGPCKNKLGHSRASVVWHRAQVIGIFAGFGILLLVASPLLLLAAPCIICCKCRSCSSKIDEGDAELDEATQLQSF